MLLSSFDLRIKGITESVAEKVEGKNCDKDYQTREIHHMRRHVQVASALGEHCSHSGSVTFAPKPRKLKEEAAMMAEPILMVKLTIRD